MRAIGLTKVCGFYLVMVGIALIAMWRHQHLNTLVPGLDLMEWARAVGSGLTAGLVMVAASRLSTARWKWASQLADEFRGLLGQLNAREALLVAAVSGIGEEALFRGALQPALGLWLASAIFGILHIGPNPRFLPWTVMAFAAGLAFGWLFAWTGNLVAPVLAHATINFLNLLFLTSGPEAIKLEIEPVGGEGMAQH